LIIYEVYQLFPEPRSYVLILLVVASGGKWDGHGFHEIKSKNIIVAKALFFPSSTSQ
jgi:hypothetical protein